MSDAGSTFSGFGHLIERGHAPGDAGQVRRQGPRKRPAKTARPETILQAFNTWAFKREQPDDADTLLRAIAEAVKDDLPLPFVLYWGKGPRSDLDTPDLACLDYLRALVGRVRAVYAPGASVKLIFTDTHAALNGHTPQSSQQYFGAVGAAAHGHGFDGCLLSELVGAADAAANGTSEAPEPPGDTLQKLISCAAKWFNGEGTAEEGALRYYEMNLTEKQAVEHAFPSAIFVTFNGSEFRCLFPDRLPVFYMYSLRRGVSAKPWFLCAGTAGSALPPAARR